MIPKFKHLSDKWVEEWEADQRVSLQVARRKARIWPTSKVAGAASRRDPLADERIFRAIQRSLVSRYDTILVGGRRPPVRKGRKPASVLETVEDAATGVITRSIWTPDWTHTGDRLKLFAMGLSIEGASQTINVRLGPKAIQAALVSPRGFCGYFSERMSRLLKEAGDAEPLYAFIAEASPVHDVHLHGIIQTTVPNLTTVLAAVGREIEMRKERQVHVEPVNNMVGWASYIAKAPLVTAQTLSDARRRIGLETRKDGLIGASLRLRRQGRDWYVTQRKSKLPLRIVI